MQADRAQNWENIGSKLQKTDLTRAVLTKQASPYIINSTEIGNLKCGFYKKCCQGCHGQLLSSKPILIVS